MSEVEFKNPIFTIVEHVKNPDAMKLVWEQLNEVGRHNLNYVIGYYSWEIRNRWLEALGRAETK